MRRNQLSKSGKFPCTGSLHGNYFSALAQSVEIQEREKIVKKSKSAPQIGLIGVKNFKKSHATVPFQAQKDKKGGADQRSVHPSHG